MSLLCFQVFGTDAILVSDHDVNQFMIPFLTGHSILIILCSFAPFCLVENKEDTECMSGFEGYLHSHLQSSRAVLCPRQEEHQVSLRFAPFVFQNSRHGSAWHSRLFDRQQANVDARASSTGGAWQTSLQGQDHDCLILFVFASHLPAFHLMRVLERILWQLAES